MFEGPSAREQWEKASAERDRKQADREAELKKLPPEQRSGAAIDQLEKHLNVKEGNPNSDPWYVYAKQNPKNFKKFKNTNC